MATNALGLTASLLLAALAACGGGDAQPPAANLAEGIDEPLAAQAATAPAQPVAQPVPVDTIDLPSPGQPLVREVYSYSGGSRDPFLSALLRANLGPEFSDLQLVAIYYNTRSPAASVAVLRDRVTGKRYSVRAGERLGRTRVLGMQTKDVTFAVDDYGTERQETLTLRKQEGDTP